MTRPTISPLNKGIGPLAAATPAAEIPTLGWGLLRENVSLPAAILYADKLQHNLDWMRRFTEAYNVRLAPHGKTTMAPRLFQMQIEAGSWAITAATAHQASVAHAFGIRRVLMANELVGKQNLEIVSELLNDPSFEFYSLVDSPALIELLAAHFRAAGKRINVLIEIGVDGGRAGVRDETQLRALVDSIAQHKDAIALRGVEVYEGVLKEEPEIRALLTQACETTAQLISEGCFEGKPILTGAGSAWFDVVAEVFTTSPVAPQVEIVLRPGCYLTHDVGNYRAAQQRMEKSNPVACSLQPGLETALHVWACVQSIPEPGRAIVGMGRRDAAFDSGLPVPALHFRPGSAAPTTAPAHWTVSKLMDQHAFLEIQAGDDLKVGDILSFDICHPCLTFDKWRVIPIVDKEFQVVDVAETYF